MSDLPLRAAAGLRKGRGGALVPPWIAPTFLVCAAVLVPWTAMLFLTLPRHYGANHWRLAWGGFDVGLLLALAATAVASLRRSPLAEIAATVTGTLLVCDAWFDIMTSSPAERWISILSAVFAELPLAAVLIWRTLFILRLTATRLWLIEPGMPLWRIPLP